MRFVYRDLEYIIACVACVTLHFNLDISIHIQNIYCGLWLNRLYLGYSYSGKYTGILTDLFGYNNYFGRIHTEFEDCLDLI